MRLWMSLKLLRLMIRNLSGQLTKSRRKNLKILSLNSR